MLKKISTIFSNQQEEFNLLTARKKGLKAIKRVKVS